MGVEVKVDEALGRVQASVYSLMWSGKDSESPQWDSEQYSGVAILSSAQTPPPVIWEPKPSIPETYSQRRVLPQPPGNLSSRGHEVGLLYGNVVCRDNSRELTRSQEEQSS